jgi:hypothetical protein
MGLGSDVGIQAADELTLKGIPELDQGLANIGKQAADELTAKGIPELIQGLNGALARLAALLDRLDGATITVTIKLAPAK